MQSVSAAEDELTDMTGYDTSYETVYTDNTVANTLEMTTKKVSMFVPATSGTIAVNEKQGPYILVGKDSHRVISIVNNVLTPKYMKSELTEDGIYGFDASLIPETYLLYGSDYGYQDSNEGNAALHDKDYNWLHMSSDMKIAMTDSNTHWTQGSHAWINNQQLYIRYRGAGDYYTLYIDSYGKLKLVKVGDTVPEGYESVIVYQKEDKVVKSTEIKTVGALQITENTTITNTKKEVASKPQQKPANTDSNSSEESKPVTSTDSNTNIPSDTKLEQDYEWVIIDLGDLTEEENNQTTSDKIKDWLFEDESEYDTEKMASKNYETSVKTGYDLIGFMLGFAVVLLSSIFVRRYN